MTIKQALNFLTSCGVAVYELRECDPYTSDRYLLFHPDQHHYAFADSLISVYRRCHYCRGIKPVWTLLNPDSFFWTDPEDIGGIHDAYTNGYQSRYRLIK